MNDRQLRSFLLSAKMNSFSKAAAISYISTPALINQINLLEKDTDLVLFHRGTHGITLTDEGEKFYTAATKIIEIYDSCLQDCHIHLNKEKQHLRICGINLSNSNQFIAYANEYSQNHPNISVDFYSIPMENKITALMADEIDLAAVAEPQGYFLNDFSYTTLLEDYYSFIVSKDHPLAQKGEITMDDLKDYHCICDKQNYRLENPENTFALSGAHITYTDKEIDDHMILNAALHGDVVMRYNIWSEHLRSRELVVLRSNIPAGNLGLLRKKGAASYIEDFISGYLSHYSVNLY